MNKKRLVLMIAVFCLLCSAMVFGAIEIKELQAELESVENKPETTATSEKAQVAESKAEIAESETNKYITETNKLLDEGKLKEALLNLYDQKETSGAKEQGEIQKAIDAYFDRVSFTFADKSGECEQKFEIEDTKFPKDYETFEGTVGLCLIDNTGNTMETVAEISLQFDELIKEDVSKINERGSVEGNNGDTVLFTVWVDSCCESYSFLYTVHTNKLTELEPDGEWQFTDDFLIGKTVALSWDKEISLFSYSWDGELLYKKEKILPSATIKGDWIYFVDYTQLNDRSIFHVYKMKSDGNDEAQLCTIELSERSELTLNDAVIWYEYNDEGELISSGSMDLFDPYDYTSPQ